MLINTLSFNPLQLKLYRDTPLVHIIKILGTKKPLRICYLKGFFAITKDIPAKSIRNTAKNK